MDTAGASSSLTGEDEPPSGGGLPGRGRRLLRCLASLMVTGCLVWAAISERWHCFEVSVAPAEVFEMFKAMTSILPGTHDVASHSLVRETEPKVVFELEAGLWSTTALDLCHPKDSAFAAFVDEKRCQDKLTRFCYDILDEKPKDPLVRRSFEKCRVAVHHGSVSFSLVLEPPKKVEAFEEVDFSTFDGLQASLEHHDADSDPDICGTLVNCDVLAELRPWNFALIASLGVALLCTLLSNYCFARSIFSQDVKLMQNGCHAILLAALMLVGVIVLDIYIGEKFAVEDVFRTEDLYYYLLPDSPRPAHSSLMELQEPVAQHVPKRLQKRYANAALDVDYWETWPMSMLELHGKELGQIAIQDGPRGPLLQIPAATWRGTLMVLSGNLMKALATGRMSEFLNPLKEATKRAWAKANRMIENWLRFLQKSLVEAPDQGTNFLTSMLEDFITMKTADDLCTAGACSQTVLQNIKATATELFMKFRGTFQEKLSEAKALIAQCKLLFDALKRFWNSVHEPVQRILDLVVQAAQSASGGIEGLLNTVVNVMGQPELVQDVALLFQRLFTDFPKIIVDVRQLADRFMVLVRGLYGILQEVQVAVDKMKQLLQGVSSISDAATSQMKMKLSQAIDAKMMEASTTWHLTAKQGVQELATAVNPAVPALLQAQQVFIAANVSSLLQGDLSFITILSSFATGGGLCSPAARIGSIFLNEIQHMHVDKRGFQASRGGLFKHFGYVTFGLILLTATMLGSYAMFLLGYV